MEVDFLIDEGNLLERVDEYTLYCHYLGYTPEIRVNYLSPFRNDDIHPSFGIFPSRKLNREYFWKDSGGRGESGDIFKLVKLMYGYESTEEAVAKVKSDFNLGVKVADRQKITRYIAKQRTDADIRVTPRDFRPEDLDWWRQFNITQQILERYRVSGLFSFWMNPTQQVPIFAGRLSFVYRIYNRYQLYFPLKDKGMKFRMDLQEEHVMGLEQLSFTSDTLVITKSYKDVMCLHSYGIEAVSPRSENTPMPAMAFEWFQARYKRIFVLFDNDGKHRAEWYPYPQIYIPHSSGEKDLSDFTRKYGPQAGYALIRQLTGQ